MHQHTSYFLVFYPIKLSTGFKRYFIYETLVFLRTDVWRERREVNEGVNKRKKRINTRTHTRE